MAACTEERGCPPYHPAMTVALLLYALSERRLFVAPDRAGSPRRGDEPPEWMRNKQARPARIRAAKAELEAEARAAEAARPPPPLPSGRQRQAAPGRKPQHPPRDEPKPKPTAQRNFTNPESRIMQGRDGFIQA